MSELIDIVDARDEVIGEAPRKGIHNTDFLHRSVHGFLFDNRGRVWLEKRAGHTDTFPGYYNSSFAGHVMKGETYAKAAEREAEEELGLIGLPLTRRFKLNASKETWNEFVEFYTAKSASKPKIHSDTSALVLLDAPQIDLMIEEGEKFVPIFLKLYSWYKISKQKSPQTWV